MRWGPNTFLRQCHLSGLWLIKITVLAGDLLSTSVFSVFVTINVLIDTLCLIFNYLGTGMLLIATRNMRLR